MDWNEYFFSHVYLAARKSKDPSSKIGAIIVNKDTIISEGYNGFPRKVLDLEERLSDRNTKLVFTVHAEHNAILNCARNGISTMGGTIYVNAFPCDGCMKNIIQAGITKVYIHKEYQDLFCKRNNNWADSYKIAKLMAEEAGIEIVYYSKFLDEKALLGGNEIKV